MLIDGIKVRNELLQKIKKEINDNNYDISFAIVLIGDNPQSKLYVNNKMKYAKEVGIKAELISLPSSTTEEVCNIIHKLNNNPDIVGIILQSPTPSNIDFDKCVEAISPNKDIDGFTKENLYSLVNNLDGLRPCTSEGIKYLLNYYNIPLKGSNVTIIGKGKLVGRPLFFTLLNEGATITVCSSNTRNLKEHTLESDIVICGAGKKHILTSDMVKDGAVVIDAGITVENGIIIGDADTEKLDSKCSYITPNPGGVGPMTVAMLLNNVLIAYKKQNNF